jgi:hypothetical protein
MRPDHPEAWARLAKEVPSLPLTLSVTSDDIRANCPTRLRLAISLAPAESRYRRPGQERLGAWAVMPAETPRAHRASTAPQISGFL